MAPDRQRVLESNHDRAIPARPPNRKASSARPLEHLRVWHAEAATTGRGRNPASRSNRREKALTRRGATAVVRQCENLCAQVRAALKQIDFRACLDVAGEEHPLPSDFDLQAETKRIESLGS